VGEGHTAVVDFRGDIYVFGDGTHGKLSYKTQSNEFEPCSIDKFKGYNVLKVVCGGCQTIILAQKSESIEDDEDFESNYFFFLFENKVFFRYNRSISSIC
jgi:alpha-tubulin suppressor-like RCC1 family protein